MTDATSDILNKTADLIEERGWTAGKGWEHEKGGPLCVEGGILAAVGGSWMAGDHYLCPAYIAVRAYLDRAPFVWNDNLAHERILAAINGSGYSDLTSIRAEAHEWATTEVIATLRAVALIEAAKENADARAAVTA